MIFLCIIFSLLPLTAFSFDHKREIKGKVIAITIPKSGTHLLAKCINLFNQDDLKTPYKNWAREISKPDIKACINGTLNQLLPPHNYKGRLNVPEVGFLDDEFCQKIQSRDTPRFLKTHWPYTKEFADFLQNDCVHSVLFMIRDPRDVLVSMAFMVCETVHAKYTLDPIVVMKDFIDARQENYISWGVIGHAAYPLIFDKGITTFYQMYLDWINVPKVLTIRFEDLVGSNGGGNDEAQYQIIEKIAHHIGVQVDATIIKNIQKNLFGKSVTFRKGLIDGWKEHFTQEMKDAYKKVPGACQLLIDLGYEKDSDW